MTQRESVSVLEFGPLLAGMVRVLGHSGLIDGLTETRNGLGPALRLNPTEALLICDPCDEAELCERLCTVVSEEPRPILLPDSDSFSGWQLCGDVEKAFSLLSAIPPPQVFPAFVQGLVAQVPAKALFGQDCLLIFVSSTLSHHLHARLGDLFETIEVAETAPITYSSLSLSYALT
jgi:hypothetical protein